MKRRVWLSIGANLGDRAGTLARAVEEIDRLPGTGVTAASALYATEPVGFADQPEFLNCAVGCDTLLSPHELLRELRGVERRLGRRPRARWHEREIDIDVILLGDLVLNDESLVLPHPEMSRRGFVLIPLAEIAPDAIHPVLLRTVADLARSLPDGPSVRKLQEPVLSLPAIRNNREQC